MLCIQCALKAMLEGKPTPSFDETMEEHMRKYHPDPEATRKERKELEQKLTAKLGGRADRHV